MNTIIQDLQSPMIKTYLKEQHVDHVWLVGSFSRGEEHDDSDIDLLFQFNNTKDLDRSIYAIPDILSDKLGKKVDILDIDYLNRHISAQVLADKISIW